MIQPYAIPGLKYRPIAKKKLSPELIEKVVCEYLEVSKQKIKSKCRLGPLVKARQYMFYFLRVKTDISLKDIGIEYNRDHTTVMHAVRKVEGFIDIDEATRNELSNIDYIMTYGM